MPFCSDQPWFKHPERRPVALLDYHDLTWSTLKSASGLRRVDCHSYCYDDLGYFCEQPLALCLSELYLIALQPVFVFACF